MNKAELTPNTYKGKLIVFEGTDGAGKTTLINLTYKYLKDKYPKKVSYLVYGTKDHMLVYPFKLLYNSFKSLFIYIKVRPKVIITTGAHTAGPMCCIGKIFGSKIIFIESMANITTKTITGRLIYKFADLFIVQWESMLKLYPKAKYGGWIF